MSPRLSRIDEAGLECGLAYQRDCIGSWLSAGAEIISVNTSAEIDELHPHYPDVRFVPSESAYRVVPGKPLVSIGEMLAVGRDHAGGKPYGLVNSDIFFLGGADHFAALTGFAEGGFVYGHRAEQNGRSSLPGLHYLYGYDLVLLDPALDYSAEMADFAIGTPWWDYALLTLLCESRAAGYSVASPIMSHLTHDQKWDGVSWLSRLQVTLRLLARPHGNRSSGDPLANVWNFFCDYIDPEMLPGHLAEGFIGHFGPVLGMALVDYIRRKTKGHLFFPLTLKGDFRFGPEPICREGWWGSTSTVVAEARTLEVIR